MIHCGTLDDVYSYEKMKHQRGDESPLSARLSGNKALSFRKSAPPQSPTVAKLGGKKTSPFRWISGQSDGSSPKRAAAQDSSISSLSLPKKTKEPSKKIGFVDILLGYHSLLQASPAYPVPRQRKELYPTVGFTHSPDWSQKQ